MVAKLRNNLIRLLGLALLFITLPCTCVRAQENIAGEPMKDAIKLAATSMTDSVRLRWAPTNFRIWQQSREAGLFIDRYTLKRDGEVLPLAERKQATRLTNTPLRPLPEAAFGAIAAQNRYAAIGGQAIYGKRFDTGSSPGDDAAFGGLLNQAREQDNRYGFGLFAADLSWVAAEMMGLAFTDRTVERNEVYLYKLVPAAPLPNLDTVGNGFVTVMVNDNAPPPPISQVSLEFDDKSAVVSWDMEVPSYFYTSYLVERSTDGIDWKLINKDSLPFVPLRREGIEHTAYFQDSLPANNRPFFYRVIGQTAFGTQGEASDPVQGMGLDKQPDATPTLSGIFPDDQQGMTISWAFLEGQKINNFQVERADNDAGPYEVISPLLPPEARTFTDATPLPVNYYRVTVFDQYDRPLTSYSALAQTADETAPAVPTNLRGLILKDGRIILNWDENEEADLLGYRIWLSNQPTAEYSLATGEALQENYYIGSTTLNTLSTTLYAKIVSLDFRHNTSEFSEFIELVRPDTLPPAAPLLTDIRSGRDSVRLAWAFSSSLDVAEHVLQRRAKGDSSWTDLKTFLPPLAAAKGSFGDVLLEKGKACEYRMVAMDHAGMSTASRIMTGCVLDDFIRRGIDKVTSSVDRRAKSISLNWTYEPENDRFRHFEIWRAKKGNNPVSIATIDSQTATTGKRKPSFTFTDVGSLRMNTTYVYCLKAVYTDGGRSSLSEGVEVNY